MDSMNFFSVTHQIWINHQISMFRPKSKSTLDAMSASARWIRAIRRGTRGAEQNFLGAWG
jgi:hypothetical protein